MEIPLYKYENGVFNFNEVHIIQERTETNTVMISNFLLSSTHKRKKNV